jgi:hypothetical protein
MAGNIAQISFRNNGLSIAALVLAALFGSAVVLYPVLAWGVVALPLFIVPLLYFQKPAWALFTFILLLPFHSLIMTILLAQVGLPISVVRVFAGWKEMLLVGTFLTVVIYTLLKQRIIRIVWVDAVAMLWFLLVIICFVWNAIFDRQASLIARLYGARDWMLYLLPYFIGRLVFISERNAQRLIKAILLIGLVTSLIGIIEIFFIPVEWHTHLGVQIYFRDFLNLDSSLFPLGLPPNYWAEMGDNIVRRAVSIYLSGQGFAIPFLLILPVVLYYYLSKPTGRNLAILCVCGLALLLTITRMTIIACFVQVLLMLWLFPKQKLLLQFLALVLMIFIVSVLTIPRFRTFVVNTVTLQDTSARVRPAQWVAGVQLLLERPWGSGLGSSGQVGARFGSALGGFGSEAGYFKVTGELGWPSLILFAGWFTGIIAMAYKGHRKCNGIWRGLALITLVTAIGFLINNLTAPPDQSTFTIYVFAWLAGLTVRIATIRPDVTSMIDDSDPSRSLAQY